MTSFPRMLGRRLFWRIYLALFASLVLVTLLIGLALALTVDNRVAGFRQLPARMFAGAIPTEDEPPGTIQDATSRLAAAVGGDLTVISAAGKVQAVSGERLHRGSADDPDLDVDWDRPPPREVRVFHLPDGRVVLARFDFPAHPPPWRQPAMLLVVALGVALAALPVVARLTHRLERLQRGVEQWGGGDLSVRVPVRGQDEIASVSASFNRAADHVQALLRAHRTLLANASHELRSPLARLSMAADLWEQDASPTRRTEIERNLAELDQLIDEILLASRLENPQALVRERVDLLALAAEEGARAGAAVEGSVVEIDGDPRQLRRLLRNLIENAEKHGAQPVTVTVDVDIDRALITVQDSGAPIPQAERDRIFEPFYRPTGRSERSGGWGLGLALVRQIALLHKGSVRCEAPAWGGTAFVVTLPVG